MSATDNSLCANAIELRSGQPTTVALRMGAPPCVEGQAPGPSNYFSVSIPARSVATMSMNVDLRTGGRIYEFDSCSDTRCRVAVEATPVSPVSAHTIVNNSAAARTVLLAVAPEFPRASVSFELRTAPLASALCERPAQLTVGAAPERADLSLGGSPIEFGCSSPRALYYAITVPASSVGRVELSGAVGSYSARWVDGCAALGCDVAPAETSLLARNTTDQPKTFLLELRGLSSSSVAVAHTRNTAIGRECEAAIELTEGASLRGDTASATSTASCAASDRAQLFYAVTIAANTRGRFTLRREGSTNVRVRLIDACDSAQCSVSTETVDSSDAPFVIDNTTAAPVQRIIAVSGTTESAPFTLQFASSAAMPSNQSCSQYQFVAPGSSVVVDTTNGGGAPVGCDTSEGRALFYNVVVPQQQRVTLTLTRTGANDLRLRRYEDCAMGRCASSNATSSEAPITVELRNEGPSMTGYLFSIGATGAPTNTGTGTLSVSAAMPL